MDKIERLRDWARLYLHTIFAFIVATLLFRFNVIVVHSLVSIVANFALVLFLLIYVVKLKRAFFIANKRSLLNIRGHLKFMSYFEHIHSVALLLALFVPPFIMDVRPSFSLTITFYALTLVYLFMGRLSFRAMQKVNAVVILRNEERVITDVFMYPQCYLEYSEDKMSAVIVPDKTILVRIECDLRLVELIVSTEDSNEENYVTHYAYEREVVGIEYPLFRKFMEEITDEMVLNIENGMSEKEARGIANNKYAELEKTFR